MEEVASLFLHGVKLVKELEETLPNITNQPHDLIRSCDEISKVFADVRDRLSFVVQGSGHHETTAPAMAVGGGSVLSQWVRMLPHQQHGFEPMGGHELGSGNVDVVETNVAPSSSVRTRRRKNEAERRTIRMPVPRMGNTEVPPEDGYTWRKYGQKEILGSRFPRGYYRCTHQKLYNCPAKKQVQRLDNDPYTLEVTYRGDHTCTMSSTAPSMPPPPPMLPEAVAIRPPPPHLAPTTSHSLPQWLSINIKQTIGSGDLYSLTQPSMHNYMNEHDNVNDAGPSSPTNYVVDYPGVTDLADTMFNSGSSSNNSMELIFSPNEEKREGGEKIN